VRCAALGVLEAAAGTLPQRSEFALPPTWRALQVAIGGGDARVIDAAARAVPVLLAALPADGALRAEVERETVPLVCGCALYMAIASPRELLLPSAALLCAVIALGCVDYLCYNSCLQVLICFVYSGEPAAEARRVLSPVTDVAALCGDADALRGWRISIEADHSQQVRLFFDDMLCA
jgi:hypothetical protein